jgi:aspartyl protease family protein
MNIAQNADIIWYILASTLVVSALLSRRISLRGALGMAMMWIAIFAVVLVLFAYRSEFGTVTGKVQTQVMGQAEQHAEGQNLRVKMADDGHFWVDGEINGTAARFLVDSGATITAVSDDVAMKAGLNVDMNGPGLMMQTANGPAVARRSSIAGLTIGPVRTSDLPIVVSDRFSGVNVLGMNFLSRLKSWRVENGEMVLEP